MHLIDPRPEYPPEWDDLHNKQLWIEKRINELLEDECNPLSPVNIAEFIGNLDPEIEEENSLLTKLRVLILKNEADFKPIIEACQKYWEQAAENEVVRELEVRFF